MLSIFLGSFLVGLSGAMAPGPLMVVAISKSAKNWKNSLKLILGHVILEAFLVLLLIAGVQVLKSSASMKIVSAAGGSFLIYMGISQFREMRELPSFLRSRKRKLSLPIPLQGVLISISNPYFLFWWFTVGSTFLLQAQESLFFGVLMFYLGHILSDISWYTLLGISGHLFAKSSWKVVYKIMLILTSLMLIGFGIYFLIGVFK
ncbi:LysE family transporter [Thermotoga sp. KOL6]|uniref:LysE family transporter n=1 Tax=Thermotoga sp. KOL6 TaxID=126741 RepID=UPI000C791DE3|nr:LysE family transporter [Thermotoga sp. KOL6]PLV59092.1 lysine transporter LysE [Thermotoga sp. KOL6]